MLSLRWSIVLVAFACAPPPPRHHTRRPRTRPPAPEPAPSPRPPSPEPLDPPAAIAPVPAPAPPTPQLPAIAFTRDVAPPAIVQTTPVLDLVDRRASYALKHARIATLAISPDGAYAATGSHDGSVVIWNVATGAQVRTVVTPHRSVWAVAIGNAGTRLATSGLDGTTRLWNAGTGKELWSKAKEADRLAFTTDGTRLVGGRYDVEWAWMAHDARLLVEGRFGTISTRPRHTQCASENTNRMVTPDGRSIVRAIVRGCRRERRGDVIDALPDGYALQVTSVDNPATRRVTGSFSSDFAVVAVSPNSDRVAAIDRRRLFVIELASGKQLGSVAITTPLPPLTRFVFARDGDRVAMWNFDDLVVWNVPAGRELWRDRFANAPADTPPIRDVIALPDGWLVVEPGACTTRALVTGDVRWRRPCRTAGTARDRLVLGRDSVIAIVDPRSGRDVIHPPAGPIAPVAELAVGPDGRVAASTLDGATWMWDGRGTHGLGGTPQREVRWIGGKLATIAPTRDGLVATIDGTVLALPHEHPITAYAVVGGRVVLEERGDHRHTVVDLAKAAAVRALPAWRSRPDLEMHDESLDVAALSHDLARAYVRGTGGELHLWNLATGRLAARAAPTAREPATLVLSPDHRFLAAGYHDGTLELRDADTLALVRALAGLTATPTIAFSPDGALVVAASADLLHVWRTADAAPLATVSFPREAPTAVAFAPDGKTLWIGTSLGNLHRFAVRRSSE